MLEREPDLWHRVTRLLLGLIERYDELAVALLVLVDEAGAPNPVPSDLAVMLAGHRIAQGEMSLLPTLLLLEGALVLGASVYYWLGARGGRPLLYRYGRHVRLSPERLDRIGERLRRHGALAVGIGRLVPGLRGITVLAAGAFGVPYRAFLPALVLSGGLYLGALLYLGAWMGPRAVEAVAGLRVPIRLAVTTLLFVGLGVVLLLLYRRAARGGQLPARGTLDAARLETAALAGFLATIEMGLGVNVLLVALNALGERLPEQTLLQLVRAAAERYAGGSSARVVAALVVAVPIVHVLWAVLYTRAGAGRLPGGPGTRGLLFSALPLAVSLLVVLPLLGAGPLGLGLGAGLLPLAGELFRNALFGVGLGASHALLLSARRSGR
jgi:membrane protein DedA with SNARE-associated domain